MFGKELMPDGEKHGFGFINKVVKTTQEIIEIDDRIRAFLHDNLMDPFKAFAEPVQVFQVIADGGQQAYCFIFGITDKIGTFQGFHRGVKGLKKIGRHNTPFTFTNKNMRDGMTCGNKDLAEADRLCHMPAALPLHEENVLFLPGRHEKRVLLEGGEAISRNPRSSHRCI